MNFPESVFNSFDRLNFREKKLLLAFSGGPDSVYLLLALKEYFKKELCAHVSLAYVNYHDSPLVDDEEEIVYHHVKTSNLKIYKTDTEFNREENKNFEEWARDFRYFFFEKLVREYGFDALVTAHQKDDHIETYKIQKRRKNLPLHSGLKEVSSLKGIVILRPLLQISKAEIYDTLKEENIRFYVDPTNDHTTRGAIRRGDHADDSKYLIKIDEENKKLEDLYLTFHSLPERIPWDRYESLSAENQKRLSFFLLDQKEIQEKREGLGKQIFDFLKAKKTDALYLNADYALYKTKDYFCLSKRLDQRSYEYAFTEKEKMETPEFILDLTEYQRLNLPDLPIIIRNARPEDRIGTDLPIKDVQLFLKKQQVPFFLRSYYPVILYKDKIQCVPFYKDLISGKLPLKLKFPL